MQIFRFGYGTITGCMSAANLVKVGGDVEMGNIGDSVAQATEEITQMVVDAVIVQQIEGNGQPGQSC